jgi:hypothetical protein
MYQKNSAMTKDFKKKPSSDNIFSDGGIWIWNVTECTTGQLLGKQLSWLEVLTRSSSK